MAAATINRRAPSKKELPRLMAFRFETANERWKWHKKSVIDPMDPSADNYNGWTNSDTYWTDVIIDNEQKTQEAARSLVEGGATVQQFADWGLQNVVGPYNKSLMDEAQKWTDEEEVAAMKERDLEQWMDQAQKYHPNDPEARINYVERMRSVTYGLLGEPQATDMNAHIIQDSQINWQEIYDSIVNDIEENQRYERQQQEQVAQQDTVENLGDASDFLWGQNGI